eukprot:6631756-Ditylum_brightwellii.AAC.1
MVQSAGGKTMYRTIFVRIWHWSSWKLGSLPQWESNSSWPKRETQKTKYPFSELMACTHEMGGRIFPLLRCFNSE